MSDVQGISLSPWKNNPDLEALTCLQSVARVALRFLEAFTFVKGLEQSRFLEGWRLPFAAAGLR